MKGCETVATPERQAKHMDVVAGIDRIKAAKRRLQRLLDEIVGTTAEKSPSEPQCSEVTLSHVLNQTGNVLATEAEEIISLVENIRGELF